MLCYVMMLGLRRHSTQYTRQAPSRAHAARAADATDAAEREAARMRCGCYAAVAPICVHSYEHAHDACSSIMSMFIGRERAHRPYRPCTRSWVCTVGYA
mmetsp:Transcript_26339/g.52883  ORF Transcript_26339/g.52883 Transcript_26339/m.52883 type:complete len:99 (+) Transcript_26339:488-784(+)